MRGHGEWILEPGDSGDSVFVWVEDIGIPPRFLGDVAVAAYRQFMRRLMKASLRNLAISVER